jgi:plastocyanin
VIRRAATLALFAAVLAGASGCGAGDNAGGGGGGKSSAAPKSVKVEIASFKFAPATIKVAKGGSITWTNHDSAPHTATAKDDAARASFNTDTLKKGEGKSVTFDETGSYEYLCLFHPFMTGTVIVE